MIRVVLVSLLAVFALSACGVKGDPLPVEIEE
jgi:predicted small lipoprotein YifL